MNTKKIIILSLFILTNLSAWSQASIHKVFTPGQNDIIYLDSLGIITNYEFSYELNVSTCTVTIRHGGYEQEKKIKAADLGITLINYSKKLKRGEFIYIESIKAIDTNGNLKELKPIKIEIK